MPNLRKRIKVKCDWCGLEFSANCGELANRRRKSKSGLVFHSIACYQEWLQEHNRQKPKAVKLVEYVKRGYGRPHKITHKTYGLVNNPKGINQYSKGKGIA
jgi:hypothetical protein